MKNNVIIFYGIPGSGKTTILRAVYEELKSKGVQVTALDDSFVDIEHNGEANPYTFSGWRNSAKQWFDTTNRRTMDLLIKIMLNQGHTVLLSIRGPYPINLFQPFYNENGDKVGPITVGCTVNFKDLLATDKNCFYKDILEGNERQKNPSFVSAKDSEIPGVTHSIGEVLSNPDFKYDRSSGSKAVDLAKQIVASL